MGPQQLIHNHDRFFRQSMEIKEIAQSIVRDSLVQGIVKNIDISTLEIVKDDWVDEKLSEYKADILYRALPFNQRVPVYILFEHKSYPDNKAPRQIQSYMNQVWDEVEKQEPLALKLPVIIPVIVYQGNKSWKISNSIKPLFAIFEGTEQYVPDFHYELIDLSNFDEKKPGVSPLHSAFFLTLKYSRAPVLFQKLPGIIRIFNNLGEKENEYLKVILLYIGTVIPKKNRDEFLEIIKVEHQEGVELMETVADSFRKEGIKEGVKEGVKEGWKEGKLDDARKMLTKGMSAKLIHEVTGLTVKEITKLQKELKNC